MHGLCQHNTTLPANIAGSTMPSFTLTMQKISKLKEAIKEDKHYTYTKIPGINKETYEYILLATFHKTTKIQVSKNKHPPPQQWQDWGYGRNKI